MEVEPLGVLEAHEQPMGWDEALARYDEFVSQNHHGDMYWFPHTDRMQVKTNNRLDVPIDEIDPVGRFRGWLDDDFLSNSVFGLVNRLGNRAPGLIPRINDLSGSLLSEPRFSDIPHLFLTHPRRVVFMVMQYAVAPAVVLQVMTEAPQLIKRNWWRIRYSVRSRSRQSYATPTKTH